MMSPAVTIPEIVYMICQFASIATCFNAAQVSRIWYDAATRKIWYHLPFIHPVLDALVPLENRLITTVS